VTSSGPWVWFLWSSETGPTPWFWVLLLALLAGGGYWWWRRRQAVTDAVTGEHAAAPTSTHEAD
jgi:LPXTG-motif cell wall-anchored protein